MTSIPKSALKKPSPTQRRIERKSRIAKWKRLLARQRHVVAFLARESGLTFSDVGMVLGGIKASRAAAVFGASSLMMSRRGVSAETLLATLDLIDGGGGLTDDLGTER